MVLLQRRLITLCRVPFKKQSIYVYCVFFLLLSCIQDSFLEVKKNRNEECVVFIKEFKFGVFNLLVCILYLCSFFFWCIIDFKHMEQSNLRSNSTVHTICSLWTCRSLFGRDCNCTSQLPLKINTLSRAQK